MDRLKLHIEQARKHLAAISRLLPGLEPLGKEDRECLPKVLDEEHAAALAAVLDVIELRPEAFPALPVDPFVWPDDFDPALARDLSNAWRVLWPLSVELQRVERLVSDYLIWVGAPVANPAEQAASSAVELATHDARAAETLGRFIAYWRKHALPRGRTRARE